MRKRCWAQSGKPVLLVLMLFARYRRLGAEKERGDAEASAIDRLRLQGFCFAIDPHRHCVLCLLGSNRNPHLVLASCHDRGTVKSVRDQARLNNKKGCSDEHPS